MIATGGRAMSCDMAHECDAPVTHIDDKGYTYCTPHGVSRQGYRPCRKLRPHELRRLERGDTLAHY